MQVKTGESSVAVQQVSTQVNNKVGVCKKKFNLLAGMVAGTLWWIGHGTTNKMMLWGIGSIVH